MARQGQRQETIERCTVHYTIQCNTTACSEMTVWHNIDDVGQKSTTFLGQGPQCIIFSALEGQRQNYDLNVKNKKLKAKFI